MSHWRARGGKKTLRASAKTRDLLRRSTNTTLRTRSADQQRPHALCTAVLDCLLASLRQIRLQTVPGKL